MQLKKFQNLFRGFGIFSEIVRVTLCLIVNWVSARGSYGQVFFRQYAYIVLILA